MPELAEAQGRRLRLVGLVHHPLAHEGGHTPARQQRLKESERRALQAARAVICTSVTTTRTLVTEYGVASNRLFVARPGTDPAIPAAEPAADGLVHLLSVGTLTHRKGHDLLVDALAGLADLPWRCVIAGSLEREPATAAIVREKIAGHGLGDRICLVGASQDLSAHYARADVFVLATRHEGYGMAFAEALRHGLPVIGTTAGAVPEVVPVTAGILVAPDDVASLAAALHRMMAEPELRRHLATGARAAAAALPRWKDTAQAVAQALLSVS
jgi:glycosyltransferase involved in cell wall biosynthesis